MSQDHSISLWQARKGNFVICRSRDGATVFEITPAGEVIIGDGFSPTEAGVEAAKALQLTFGILFADVEAEREACVKIAEKYEREALRARNSAAARFCLDIAAAIRARGTQT